MTALPSVSVPQKEPDGVDDGGLAQRDLDALVVHVLDGVSREAPVQVVVLAVAVQQRGAHLALQHGRSVLGRAHILLGDWRVDRKE